jgi:hypothetical protein
MIEQNTQIIFLLSAGFERKYFHPIQSSSNELFRRNRMSWIRVDIELHKLTPWSRILLEKLTVAQTLRKFPIFRAHKSSLLSSKEPATGQRVTIL